MNFNPESKHKPCKRARTVHRAIAREGKTSVRVAAVVGVAVSLMLAAIAMWYQSNHARPLANSAYDTNDLATRAAVNHREDTAQHSSGSISRPITNGEAHDTVQPVPGVPTEPVDPSLAGVVARVDSRKDRWPVEVFSDAAAGQLTELSRLIASGHGQRSRLGDVIADRFACTALRPHNLRRTFEDAALTVWKPAPGYPEDQTTSATGADGLMPAIDWLWEPLADGREASVQLKLFRVHVSDDGADTAVIYQARARQQSGVVQQSATWKCRWDMSANGEPPRIRSIEVVDYEEVIPRTNAAVLFSDCTAAVLGGNESFHTQLVRGIDDWRRQLDVSFDPDLSGHQGIAIADVNGDGRDDVYVCQQGGLPNRLFVQLADGTLADVTSSSGADQLELSSGVLLIDLDNDGDQDLTLATAGALLVFENDGSARFRRRQRIAAGATLQSLTAADFDLDGDLDVYACGYSPGNSIWKADGASDAPVPYYDANNGGPNMLLRNDGDFRLANVTKDVGLDANNRRFSFAASWEDYDNDGDPDLYVANDFGRNNLYRNDGGRFVDVAAEAGVEDMASGMSVSWGDFDNDGWMDLYVGNMFSSAGNRIVYQRQFLPQAAATAREDARRTARGNSLFRGGPTGQFVDVSEPAAVTRGRWAWASKFVDVNNDGWEDLVVANGFITHEDTGDL